MREPGPVLSSVLYCRDLSCPLSHIINPRAVSCLANRQTWSLQSWGTSWNTLLPPSYSSAPLFRKACPSCQRWNYGKKFFNGHTLAHLYILLCSNLFSGGCEGKVQEIRTHFSSSWENHPHVRSALIIFVWLFHQIFSNLKFHFQIPCVINILNLLELIFID